MRTNEKGTNMEITADIRDYLYKKLADKQVLITTLSRGVAVGTELQYADEVTLSRSLLQRQPFKL